MPQRAPPSRPFASSPNRAGPTRLFASVPKSLPTLAQEACQERPPRRAANEPWEIGTDEGVGLNNAAAHRAALALDEPPGCPVALRTFRVERGAPKDCAPRATAVQSPQTASSDVLAATRQGARAHANAADAVSDPGSIAAFVELVYLRALLEATRSRTSAAEACFQESSGMAIEQPQRLQHDHALVEARGRFGVIARCQGRAAKLQSVIADSAGQLPQSKATSATREATLSRKR